MTQSNVIPKSIAYEFNDEVISRSKVETPDIRIAWDPEGEAEFLRSHDLLIAEPKFKGPVTFNQNPNCGVPGTLLRAIGNQFKKWRD